MEMGDQPHAPAALPSDTRQICSRWGGGSERQEKEEICAPEGKFIYETISNITNRISPKEEQRMGKLENY
jgi:hypothetical protein